MDFLFQISHFSAGAYFVSFVGLHQRFVSFCCTPGFTVVEGVDIAIYLNPQSAAEEEDIGKAALDLLSHILRNKEFRKRVAQIGKLTIMLNLDLSKITDPF